MRARRSAVQRRTVCLTAPDRNGDETNGLLDDSTFGEYWATGIDTAAGRKSPVRNITQRGPAGGGALEEWGLLDRDLDGLRFLGRRRRRDRHPQHPVRKGGLDRLGFHAVR